MDRQNGNNKIDKDVYDELCEVTGREYVFGNIEDRVCYSFDATESESIPDLVIMPHSTEQVSGVLSIANKHNIPIYTREAGIGLTGGSVPVKGAIVLDMKKMNRVVELNARDLTITVEPGVTINDLQDEAAESRLFYPPEPGRAGFSTIGGIVAECTGGMTGMKYGVTREYVLAMEIVLPDGSVINAGRKTLKSVAGYDLARFFVGSEGTLGVLTKITLKLLPMSERRCMVLSLFKDIDSALDATDSILIDNHLCLHTLEFVDKAYIAAVRESTEVEISAEVEALLLIGVDGNEKNVANDIAKIDAICRENSALDVMIVHTDEEREGLWNIRRAVSMSLPGVASVRFSEDLSVPRGKVRTVLKKAYELSETYSLQVTAFGQIGEGHIHLNIISNSADAVDVPVRNLVSQILKDAESYGRADISALTPHEAEIMNDLKEMFDPEGIMNPGKVFL